MRSRSRCLLLSRHLTMKRYVRRCFGKNRFSWWKGIPFSSKFHTPSLSALRERWLCGKKSRCHLATETRLIYNRAKSSRCFALITRWISIRSYRHKKKILHTHTRGTRSLFLSRNFFAKLIIAQKKANVIQCAFTMFPTNWACLSATSRAPSRKSTREVRNDIIISSRTCVTRNAEMHFCEMRF